jgi:hypothetical protein
LLQKLRDYAASANRRLTDGSEELVQLGLRVPFGEALPLRRRLCVPVDNQGWLELPHPVRITHVAA